MAYFKNNTKQTLHNNYSNGGLFIRVDPIMMWLGSGWHFRPFILKMIRIIRVEERLEPATKQNHASSDGDVSRGQLFVYPFPWHIILSTNPSLHISLFPNPSLFFLRLFHPSKPLTKTSFTWSKKKNSFFFWLLWCKKNLFLPRWLLFNDVPDSFYVFFLYVLL